MMFGTVLSCVLVEIRETLRRFCHILKRLYEREQYRNVSFLQSGGAHYGMELGLFRDSEYLKKLYNKQRFVSLNGKVA